MREKLREDKQDIFWDIDKKVRDNAIFKEMEYRALVKALYGDESG